VGLGKFTEDATVIPRATLRQMTVQFAVESVSSLPWNHCPVCCGINYANEMAYREDTRRWSNGDIFRDIVGKCARALASRDWCGYWQGNHRLGESLAV
jgi:hypothetical protein